MRRTLTAAWLILPLLLPVRVVAQASRLPHYTRGLQLNAKADTSANVCRR